jgi:hypothetical protein
LDDPAAAPKVLFTEADIKSALNVRYLELREKARFVGDGSALKITYETGVNGTYLYDLPADFLRLKTVHVDLDGGDLSSIGPGSARIRLLEPQPFENVWDAYQVEKLIETRHVSIFDRQYAILAPIDADSAGSNSIRLVYEAATAELTQDDDEPTISRHFHDVIPRLAAVDLLASKNMDNQTQSNLAFARMREFELSVTEELWSPDSQAYVAGLDDQEEFTQRMGTIDW